ncbi:MAG TPA: ABC transporter permease, partial [Blastocatellia bacterium]|nr:ABC transporter permease [Blastocatellia bacterium]
MESLVHDFKHSFRMLARRPGFTAVAVLALALGIGANSAIFSVVNSVLLSPLPYKNSDRLMVGRISLPELRDIREATQIFEDVSVVASNLYNLTTDGEPEQVLGGQVSPNFFQMLGQPVLGRAMTSEDENATVAVLSYGFWQKRYGGDPDVIGRGIMLGDDSYTIIGVMPPEFQFPNGGFMLWSNIIPVMLKHSEQAENRTLRIFRVVALLKPGVTPEQANSALGTISERLENEYPDSNRGITLSFIPLYEWVVGDIELALYILLGTVGLVLLIACANVANLLLARTTAREREIAIRTAIGASRGRIIRQLLTESVALSFIGGALGLLLASWCIDLIPSLGVTDIPRADFIGIDLGVMFFTLAVSVGTGLLFGLAPAVQASKTSLGESLKEGGRGTHASATGKRLRSGLVVAEVALSVVVLVGAGLLIKSFASLMDSRPGFVAENLTTMNVQLVIEEKPEHRAQLAGRVLEEVRRLPGVQVAGGGTGLPPETPQRMTGFEIEGRPIAEDDSRFAYFMAVT